jgi:hypothetical protein
MRLYTFQSLEVISQLWTDKVFRPSWDRCVWLCDDEPTRMTFEPPYRWMVEQYRLRRPRFANGDPLVWWFTDIDEARKGLVHEPNTALISADVPDERILLHNADDWYYVLGHTPYPNLVANEEDLPYEDFDRWWNIYKKPENRLAIQETWNHIFHLPKRDRYQQTIHAVTDCIYLEWVEAGRRPR